MAKQFIYAPANELWLTQIKTFNPDFNTLPFDYQQPKIHYYYKRQLADVSYLQCLSDWVPELWVINEYGQTIDTIVASTPANGIINQTFTVYEFQINWVAYGVGVYTVEIHYTDDTPTEQIWQSPKIDVKVKWPQTVLLNYTNSENRFSIVWSTGIIINLRVEGNIEDYTPAFDDVIYNDQEYNTTKLHSIPHREFSFYVGANQGGFQGIPNWIADKVNWAFSCDQLQIDGIYYQNTASSKWDIRRTDPDGTNFIGLKISIIEVNNLFLNEYQPGDLPEGTIQVITRALPYKNNSANITIPGIFKTYSKITCIYIWNKGGDIFTINVGTASDGSEPITNPYITTGDVSDLMQLNHAFIDAETIYITGLTGTNCDIFVEYDQLDAPTIAPIVSNKPFVKGHLGMYEEVVIGDFEIDWNIGTGTGNVGTKYEGCVLSGTNGTEDRNGLLAIGWDSSMPLTRDTVVGAVGNLATIARANLPAESLAIPDLTVNSSYHTGGNSQHAAANDPSAPRARTENMGSGVPLSIANRARVTVYFVCITD